GDFLVGRNRAVVGDDLVKQPPVLALLVDDLEVAYAGARISWSELGNKRFQIAIDAYRAVDAEIINRLSRSDVCRRYLVPKREVLRQQRRMHDGSGLAMRPSHNLGVLLLIGPHPTRAPIAATRPQHA